MKSKKTQLRRLMAIYTVFLIVLVVGFVHGFAIDFAQGFTEGSSISETMQKHWESGDRAYYSLYTGIPVNSAIAEIEVDKLPTDVRKVEASYKRMNLLVEKNAGDNSILGSTFRILGDNPVVYLIIIISLLARLSIVILMALIISMIRSAIRNDAPLPASSVQCTRIIGGLLIFTELLMSFSVWLQWSGAARLLEGSIEVNKSFDISWWNIMMGILVIFTAEVFAIGRQLGEEQKFTI